MNKEQIKQIIEKHFKGDGSFATLWNVFEDKITFVLSWPYDTFDYELNCDTESITEQQLIDKLNNKEYIELRHKEWRYD